MDEETIKTLVATQLEGLLDPIVSQLSQGMETFLRDKVEPRLAAIETSVPKATSEPKDGTDEKPASLTQRLALLEKQLADREAKIREQSFDSELSSALSKYPTPFQEQAKKLIKAELAESQESEGRWLTKDGKTFQEAVDGFFGSDFGKHLLPAETVSGAGVKPTDPTAKVGTGNLPDLNSLITQAFL